jgi:hypothetical protein
MCDSEESGLQVKASKISQNTTLWQYLISRPKDLLTPSSETVFKCKDPKKYIQVKTSLINNGT